MNKKLLITLVVAIVVGLGFLTYRLFFANKNIDLTPEECFEFNESTGTITKYKDICGTEVNIPSKIGGKEVKIIDKLAFMNKKLTKLILPETLEEVGIGAFQNNSIEELIIPDTVKNVKALAFYNNKIKKLTIGKGVTNIGIEAFNNNQLKAKDAFIYLRDENGVSDTVVVGYAGAERDNVIIPDKVEMLYLSALAECSIKGVTLNDDIERLEASSLASNDLTEITIPKNVIIISQGAFSGNANLEKITVEGKKAIEDFSLFDTTGLDTSIIEFKK